MSEKPEEAMKNGQSRETVNTGHIRHGQSRETVNTGHIKHRMKTNNNKNTTQKTKKMNNMDPTKNGGVSRHPRLVSSPRLSQETTMSLI